MSSWSKASWTWLHGKLSGQEENSILDLGNVISNGLLARAANPCDTPNIYKLEMASLIDLNI